MFPVRESSRYLAKALAALLIATQLVLLSLTVLVNTSTPTKQKNNHFVSGPKDSWGLLPIMPLINEPQKDKSTFNVQKIPEAEVKSDVYSTEKINNKIIKLANKYNVDPNYLNYIVSVEKKFNLEPCELLALIAQESGFKPQTHMDGGSLSYSTTQMKMPTAKTAYMAITEYYKMDIPYPTEELLIKDKYYAAFLAGGYLRYLHDVYKDKYESYTAYNWGIGGRMIYYKNNGHFKSPYAIKVANLVNSFAQFVGEEYKGVNSIRQVQTDDSSLIYDNYKET